MKKVFLCFIAALAGCSTLLAQKPAPPTPQIRAFLNYGVFYAPQKGPYIETYLSVSGNTVFFKKTKNTFKGSVLVQMAFSQEGKTIQGGTYTLNSIEILDTSKKPVMLDIQRYSLQPGKYDLSLSLTDVNRTNATPLKASQTIEIGAPQNGTFSFSDVELLESFTKSETPSVLAKSGYDQVPYVLRYFPESINKIAFYTEGYNANQKLGKDSRFMYAYFIEGAEAGEKVKGMFTYSKQKSSEVNPLIGQFDISQLPTGDYNLVIEARDTANGLMAVKKVNFTRIAQQVKIKIDDISTIDTTGTFISRVVNPDTLKDYIACLWPISSTTERDWQYSQIRNADVKIMQQYIYAFWINRDSKNAELAWKTYRAQAVKVKKEFACGKIPGYMTDRGRVYLQYGAPSAAQQQPAEPDSYPYEIWQYYRIKDPVTGQFQSNKKFVFYNRELDGKCYDLIHSDARGEMRDDRWQIKLKQRNNQILNLDQTTPNNSILNMPGNNAQPNGNTYGSGADDLFINPR